MSGRDVLAAPAASCRLDSLADRRVRAVRAVCDARDAHDAIPWWRVIRRYRARRAIAVARAEDHAALDQYFFASYGGMFERRSGVRRVS